LSVSITLYIHYYEKSGAGNKDAGCTVIRKEIRAGYVKKRNNIFRRTQYAHLRKKR
jgi:hypothetical protein